MISPMSPKTIEHLTKSIGSSFLVPEGSQGEHSPAIIRKLRAFILPVALTSKVVFRGILKDVSHFKKADCL